MDCMALWYTLGESNFCDQWKTILLPNWLSRLFLRARPHAQSTDFQNSHIFQILELLPAVYRGEWQPSRPILKFKSWGLKDFRRVVSLSIINIIYYLDLIRGTSVYEALEAGYWESHFEECWGGVKNRTWYRKGLNLYGSGYISGLKWTARK